MLSVFLGTELIHVSVERDIAREVPFVQDENSITLLFCVDLSLPCEGGVVGPRACEVEFEYSFFESGKGQMRVLAGLSIRVDQAFEMHVYVDRTTYGMVLRQYKVLVSILVVC